MDRRDFLRGTAALAASVALLTFGTRHRHAGVGFLQPPATVLDLAAAPDGGGSRWCIPQAVHHGDETILAYIRGTDGTQRLMRYVHSTDVTSLISLHGSFERDDHSNASIRRRTSDGAYVALYPRHNNTPFNRRILPDVTDSGTWSSVLNLDAQLGGSRYTYPQNHEMLAEGSDWFRTLFRDEPSAGTDSRWCMSLSTDGCVSFAPQQIIYRVVNKRSYMATWSDGQGRIHCIVSHGGSTIAGAGFTALGHFYYDEGAWRQSDGTDMGDPPFGFDDTTPILTGSQNMFPAHVYIDDDGWPVVAAFNEDALGIWHYWYCRFNGTSWVVTEVANGGTGYPYSSPTSTTPYGCCLDDGDVNVMYAIIKILGRPEVWRFETSDGGVTFSGSRAITRFSSAPVLREPMPIRYRDPELRVAWQAGTFASYTNYSVGIQATAT